MLSLLRSRVGLFPTALTICLVGCGTEKRGGTSPTVLAICLVGCGTVEIGRRELGYPPHKCDFSQHLCEALVIIFILQIWKLKLRVVDLCNNHWNLTLELFCPALPAFTHPGTFVITLSVLVSRGLPGGLGKSSSPGEKKVNYPAMDRQIQCPIHFSSLSTHLLLGTDEILPDVAELK